MAPRSSLLWLAGTLAVSQDVLLPPCQEKSRRPRSSTLCQSTGHALGTLENTTECTDVELCNSLSQSLRKPRCNGDPDFLDTNVSDGSHDRYLYVYYPTGCDMPSSGWPFLLFFGFDVLGNKTQTISAELQQIRKEVLGQGIAFVETSMYFTDTYDNHECNTFQINSSSHTDGSCRSCSSKSTCEALEHWFLCANAASSWDVQMLHNLFASIRSGKDQGLHLDLDSMGYIGWSVGAHMTSRAIELGAGGLPFPKPRCAVMISGGSYHCYTCPEPPQNLEPSEYFHWCNWWSQGSTANSDGNNCGKAFPPLDKSQNQHGVCPGYTMYENESNWWERTGTQQPSDVLRTESSWDSCKRAFSEHPPVLLVQPWEDSDAYWNAAQNYYEVLAHQEGGAGCRMYAGRNQHGPVASGHLHTINFLLEYLMSTKPESRLHI